jgi:hypothetical protein
MNNEVKPDYGTSYDKGANPWVLWLTMISFGLILYGVVNKFFPEKKFQSVRVFHTQYKGDSVLVLLTDSGAQVLEVTGKIESSYDRSHAEDGYTYDSAGVIWIRHGKKKKIIFK